MPDYITKSFSQVQSRAAQTIADRCTGDGEQVGDRAPPFPILKVHELRHSHATILLRAHVPVHVVAKRLGHKDPSVTLDVYAGSIPDDDTSAVDVFRQAVRLT